MTPDGVEFLTRNRRDLCRVTIGKRRTEALDHQAKRLFMFGFVLGHDNVRFGLSTKVPNVGGRTTNAR